MTNDTSVFHDGHEEWNASADNDDEWLVANRTSTLTQWLTLRKRKTVETEEEEEWEEPPSKRARLVRSVSTEPQEWQASTFRQMPTAPVSPRSTIFFPTLSSSSQRYDQKETFRTNNSHNNRIIAIPQMSFRPAMATRTVSDTEEEEEAEEATTTTTLVQQRARDTMQTLFPTTHECRHHSNNSKDDERRSLLWSFLYFVCLVLHWMTCSSSLSRRKMKSY